MKPTGGEKTSNLPADMNKTNANKKNETTDCVKAQFVPAANLAVKVMRLGIDLHKKGAVVTMQLGDSPAQPAQRVATGRFEGWVEQQQKRHPNAKTHFIHEGGILR